MGSQCWKHSRAVPRANTGAHDPHTPPCCETSALCTFPTFIPRQRHTQRQPGKSWSSLSQPCTLQVSRAQTGAWIRAQFSQSVILTGALVLNNFVVPQCENGAHNCPLLNPWCDDLLAQQLIKYCGVSKLSWLPWCVWGFFSSFVAFQCNADKERRQFRTGFLPKGYGQAETVPHLDYFLVQGWGAHLQECQAVEILSAQKPQKRPHTTHSCLFLLIFFLRTLVATLLWSFWL